MPLNQETTNYFVQLKQINYVQINLQLNCKFCIHLVGYCSVIRAHTYTIKNKQAKKSK